VKKIGRTSNEVKRRWIDANYSTIRADIPKETADAFRKKCKIEGISQAQIIKAAIDDFLKDK
jgi:hypothetical protein